jgi:hypothetical protein
MHPTRATEGPAVHPRLAAAPDRAPDWLPQHRAAWNRFLESEAGRTLWARLRAVKDRVQVAGCADVFNTVHAAGTAHGWNECSAWLLSLSRSSRVTDETDSPPAGEPELAERLSP